MSEPALWPGDIVLTASDTWLGRRIRGATRDRGEAPSVVNHAAIVVAEASETSLDMFGDAQIVEARAHVVRHTIREGYGKGSDRLMVARPLTLTYRELDDILDAAVDRVGQGYGYGLIAAHLADWSIGRLLRRKRAPVFFRKLHRGGRDVCSGLLGSSLVVVDAFRQVELDFGIPGYAATPDDLYDFVSAGKHYSIVRPLGPWPIA